MTNASYKMNEDGTFDRIDEEETTCTQQESKCTNCSKHSEPCIPFFTFENSMMHKDVDNERAHRTTLFVCIAFVLIVIIFVTAYTVRTGIWLDTIAKLNAAIVELSNAKGVIVP